MSSRWQTLDSRKADAASKIASGLTLLRRDFENFARFNGGSFLIYGSAARGDLHFGSDVDIIVDFPGPIESEAWQFAEDVCCRYSLRPDIRPKALCTSKFIDHIKKDAAEIS